MKHLSLSLLLISFLLIFSQCKKDEPKPAGPVKYNLVLIHTDYGNMLVWLYDQTPFHRDNFLQLTKDKFYDSLIFHRILPNTVIEGGDSSGDGTGGKATPLAPEFHDSITNIYGAIGAVMENTPTKNTNGTQFYIVVNKSGVHSRDKTYTVFGQVIDGMSATDAIVLVDRGPNDKPLANIYMTKVEVIQYTEEELKTLYKFIIPKFE
jgi:peptidyl-prolyl cis-trans isomerase B (cyclophilin B)